MKNEREIETPHQPLETRAQTFDYRWGPLKVIINKKRKKKKLKIKTMEKKVKNKRSVNNTSN